MSHPIVVIVALENEFAEGVIPSNIPVVYSGVGKVNAAIATFKAILKFHPKLIVNFGTAGGIRPLHQELIQIGSVIQRDMVAEPLAPRGVVPFSNNPYELFSVNQGSRCATGDSFVTAHDKWLLQKEVDVVDMELFAIAQVAFENELDWISFKYVSDHANQDSAKQWSNKVNQGQHLFRTELQRYI